MLTKIEYTVKIFLLKACSYQMLFRVPYVIIGRQGTLWCSLA